jgi:5-methylcytosine-specific restriction endonuclease McrA
VRSEWQRNHPDKIRGYNRDRNLHKKHEISEQEWESCKNYFNYRCAYCGLPIEEHFVKYKGKIFIGDFHRDHVNDEGNNDLSNCIPACKSCNTSKHIHHLEEWYNENNPNFNQERLDKINKWLDEDYKKYINKVK